MKISFSTGPKYVVKSFSDQFLTSQNNRIKYRGGYTPLKICYKQITSKGVVFTLIYLAVSYRFLKIFYQENIFLDYQILYHHNSTDNLLMKLLVILLLAKSSLGHHCEV